MREQGPSQHNDSSEPEDVYTIAELAQRMDALRGAVDLVTSGDLTAHGLTDLCGALARALHLDRVALWEFVDSDQSFARIASVGDPLGTVSDQVGLADVAVFGHFLVVDQPVVIADVSTTGGANTAANFGDVRSLFGAPLIASERMVGLIIGDRNGGRFTLHSNQMDLAKTYCNLLAISLDRRRSHDTLRSQHTQWAAMVASHPDAVVVCDAQGCLVSWNPALPRWLRTMTNEVAEPEQLWADLSWSDLSGGDQSGKAHPEAGIPLGGCGKILKQVSSANGHTPGLVELDIQPLEGLSGRPAAGAVIVIRPIIADRGPVSMRQLAEAEASASRAAAIAELAIAVNSGVRLPDVLHTAVDHLCRLLAGDSAAIFFREPDGGFTGQAGVRFDPPATQWTIEPSMIPTTVAAVTRREPHYYTYEDASESERVFFDQLQFRAAIIVPLVDDDELIGVAYVNFSAERPRPTTEDLHFASALAGQSAVAISKARMMQRWEAAHRRLLAVMDQLPQGVVIVSAPDGELVLANRAADALWSRPLLGLVTHHLATAAGGDDTATSAVTLPILDGNAAPFPPGQTPLERTLREGIDRLGEPLTIPRHDGTMLTVVANHAPITGATGEIVGAVGVLQDIAQLRELDRVKDEFLSVVAHELRNPLTSLRGNMQLLLRRLRRQGDPERQDEMDRLESLIQQSDRLGELVSRLLDVSRADLDRLDLALTPADAVEIIVRAVDSAGGLAIDHAFETMLPESYSVVWDSLRIEQVLNNLLSNAIKYTPSGRIRLTLEELDEGRFSITVEDEGSGIPDATKARLFERYYRGSQEADQAREGLGIGLYISHKIATAHGGDLTVSDAASGGARFTLTLPRDSEAQRAARSVADLPQSDSLSVAISQRN